MSALVMTRRTLLVLVAATLYPCAASPQITTRPVVVLGVPAEVRDIEARLVNPAVEHVQGAPFTAGSIGATRVILARRLAATLNYVPAPGTTRAPVVREGVIVTGDTFVADATQRDELRRALRAFGPISKPPAATRLHAHWR